MFIYVNNDAPMSENDAILASNTTVLDRGFEEYQLTFDAMRACTAARTADTPDQLWIIEHPPVFTLGLKTDPVHLLDAHAIPVVQSDRGGEVTYHGPGQAIIYLLYDLRRHRAAASGGVRAFVHRIEQGVIETLAAYKLAGMRKDGAPGVYVKEGARQGAKIAALGLKVSASGYTYHGVSLNVGMDLAPFSWINPCGYEELETVDMRTLGVDATLREVQVKLASKLIEQLKR